MLPVIASDRKEATCASTGPSYEIETWGCQMNVLDGERMAGQLEGLGFRKAVEQGRADVVILNTCAVREKAEAKVYSALGVLGLRKQARPDLVIGVTGCVAQVEGDEILERAPFVDFVLGTGEVEALGEAVERARRERRHFTSYELPEESPVYQFRQITRGSPFQAYVTVIEGCDQFCTFCIVPFTRGRERSRAASEVLEELRYLAGSGYTEVTLLGQTVNAYRDPEEGFGLGELLRRASRIEGVRRLRFLTSHPRLVEDSLLEALASQGAIAPYLHLPAQSGSDRILYRMKRRYDAASYRETVRRLRSAVPGLAVSSDFIVGFPGETEEDFQATLSLVSELSFESLFAFRYSPRPGTASARWGSASQVPEEVSAERLSRLLALQGQLQAGINRSLEGREFEVLIEGEDRQGQSRGRTACNRIVHVRGAGPIAAGSYVRVSIERGLPNSLIGRLADGAARPAETKGAE
ncbi:MAG: tRNA (N6-isopentenyl adenosine(37)-C2)-methylthiotransferase MiaB [Thermoanaerobaculia bacterium]